MDDQINSITGINEVGRKLKRIFQKVGDMVLVVLFAFAWAAFYLFYKFR